MAGLVSMLSARLLGFPDFHIIDRCPSDGYALSADFVDKILAQFPDVKLVVTSDVGVTAFDFVDRLKGRGIDVLVTDHHMPNHFDKQHADVVINELLDKDFLSKNTEVCGAYVIYQLFERFASIYFPNMLHCMVVGV